MSESNGYVTRDTVFANPPQRRFRDTEFDGIGKVRIRTLTAGEMIDYGNRTQDSNGVESDQAGVLLIVIAVVDGNGNQLFTDADVDWLLGQDAQTIQKLASDCVEHCSLPADEDTAKN